MADWPSLQYPPFLARIQVWLTMRTKSSVLGLLWSLAVPGRADPTWPSATDELEALMYQVSGFGSRGFGARVTPCSSNVAGPGRQSAAQWLRTALHDVASGNVYLNMGGLDGSLQYETNYPENVGPGFNETLKAYSDFYNNRVGVADLIALGVYYSVRACGGPSIPLRGGRIDATMAGPMGFVPQPQDGFGTFCNRFARLGYNITEMIQVVACGHSIGGVHSPEFAALIPPNSVNGVAFFDTTPSGFDNRVVVEYLAGNTTNPLVTGPSVALRQNSDMVVFAGDQNQTVQGLQDRATFQSVCRSLLQRMIEVVPDPSSLSAPILPYTLKPVSLQLTLTDGGSSLALQGWIRVRATMLPISISSLDVSYKDRGGGTSCGPYGCTRTLTARDTSSGFDDSFVWFPLDITIPSKTGISSFTCTLRFVDGTARYFDNNGAWFQVQDAILFQTPQSCLSGGSKLTVTAAVRNERSSNPVTLVVYQKSPGGGPVAVLSSNTTAMSKRDGAGPYTFYTANYAIPGGLGPSAKIDVVSSGVSGTAGDYFKDAGILKSTCPPFSVPAGPSSTPTKPPSSSSEPSRSKQPSPTATEPGKFPDIATYKFMGCFTEGDRGVRALGSRSFANDFMTLEACAAYCTAYHYFGTEYGRECYCGDTLDQTSHVTVLAACDMDCSGNAKQECGAGNRLSLYYSNTTYGPSQPPRVGDYAWHGCRTEGSSGRALEAARTSGPDMTLSRCAQFCQGYAYFGTEYGRECYCGNSFAAGSTPVSFTDCSMPCVGNGKQLCGAGDRLSVYTFQAAPVGAYVI